MLLLVSCYIQSGEESRDQQCHLIILSLLPPRSLILADICLSAATEMEMEKLRIRQQGKASTDL
jgi:hypothetical protein